MGAGQIRTGISGMRERYLQGITLPLKPSNLGELCVLPFKLQSPRKSITKAALAVNRHHRRQAYTDENLIRPGYQDLFHALLIVALELVYCGA